MDLVIANIAGSVRQAPVSPPEAASPAANAAPRSPASSGAAAPAGADPASPPAGLTPDFTVVVLELRNAQGAVVTTVPSAQQLAAYRNGTATPPS